MHHPRNSLNARELQLRWMQFVYLWIHLRLYQLPQVYRSACTCIQCAFVNKCIRVCCIQLYSERRRVNARVCNLRVVCIRSRMHMSASDVNAKLYIQHIFECIMCMSHSYVFCSTALHCIHMHTCTHSRQVAYTCIRVEMHSMICCIQINSLSGCIQNMLHTCAYTRIRIVAFTIRCIQRWALLAPPLNALECSILANATCHEYIWIEQETNATETNVHECNITTLLYALECIWM